MIRVIEGLPDNVVAVSGTGEVSSDDYISTLDPAIDAAQARLYLNTLHPPIAAPMGGGRD